MNPHARLILLAVGLLVGLGVPGWADTMPTHLKVKGEQVIATFEAPDPQDRCLVYTVIVIAGDDMTKLSPDGGPAAEFVRTTLFVDQADVCEGVVLLDGNGETSEGVFQVAGNLSTATVRTTVTRLDEINRQNVLFAVDLTWTATDKPVDQNDKESLHDTELGILVVSHHPAKVAPAAASGTVVALGLNFTPEPSVGAEIDTQNDGSILIEKTP